ncbi:Centrosome and spindle pole-associated protein 1 [Holothuria leucospilota]|uniref:Centrosome and spindle pole-associated protein 1 n=1 Tax=Holothuria leucospilota TaxID=206669 RepID=A0A9Q1H5K0_HOLLE|nr:Centrosome and spindle pole-associated protein 1 [Holothuria leucospilota]
MADDIEQFIAQQKSRLARERQELQQQNTEKVYQDLTNGNSSDLGGRSDVAPANGVKDEQNTGSSIATFGQQDQKLKLQKERQQEYEQFLREKEARSVQKRTVPEGDGMSLPIRDRTSAKARAENQRNQEYKAFLKEKERKERQKREERRGLGPPTREPPVNNFQFSNEKPVQTTVQDNRSSFETVPDKKEAASQTPHPPPDYDDSRPPRPPRRGWGSPQPGPDYDDLLRRRREEEARYRRYGDLDYYPARGSLRPSRSDPRLDRYPDEDGINGRSRDYEDREYERRRVRFTDLEASGQERVYSDRPQRLSYERQDLQNGYPDQIGVTRSKTLPDLERSVSKQTPRVKSASASKEEGFIIGNRESNSAAQRKKEQYRQELAKQIQEQKEAKQREKERERQEDLRLVSQAAVEPSRSGRRSVVSSRTPQPNVQPPANQPYTPSFLNQAYNARSASQASGYPNQYAINSAVPPLNVPANIVGNSLQPQIPNLGLADNLTRPPPAPEQIGSLGLEEAYARSRPSLVEQPFSLAGQTTLVQPSAADPYMYYKLRNPLDPDPNYNQRQLPFQPNTTFIPMYVSPNVPVNGVPPGQLISGPAQPLLSVNQVSNSSGAASRNHAPEGDISPRALKDPKSYQAQLLLQMKEKERRKFEQKEAEARYEAKIEAEAQNYNPWGKGGGGAPMRNAKGEVFADLKKLHNLNEQALQDPQKPVALYSDTKAPTNPAAPTGLARAIAERGIDTQPDAPSGGPSAAPDASANQGIGNPVDLYKLQLQQQVDEKKRREAAEKEKIRLEEEKEERRLAEQREKMKREFEQEQEAKRKKEEEKQKQQQELQAKIEEKRKEAEERKKEARSIKRDPVTTVQNEQIYQRQVASPPIPTLRKDEPSSSPVPEKKLPDSSPAERLKSPPIPTLRKKTEKSAEDSEVEKTPRQDPTPRRDNRDEELPATARSVSPPVPAVSNRERDGGERDVISALSAMRKQLQSEQRRVQSQLEKHRDYDPYVHTKPQAVSRKASPQVDIFEVARHKGSVAVRREPINHQVADEFNNLRNRGGSSQSRQKLREQYPTAPNSNLALEAQQRALLKHQQSRLEEIKRENRNRQDVFLPHMEELGRASESPAVPLESSSAFIGIDSGEAKLPSKEISKEIYDFYLKPSPEPTKPIDPYGSTSSFDNDAVERLAKKNKARNEALKALEPDAESLADADDILNQFLAKQSIDSPLLRPPSEKSEDLSLWLKPSD